jgi:GAF domain
MQKSAFAKRARACRAIRGRLNMTDATSVFDALRQVAGVRLFTITVVDRRAGVARRAYSSHPVDYPVTGTKPIGDDGWSRQVLAEGKSFVANTTPEFAIYFGDHALINALGCHSAMNIPVLREGVVAGTVNLLDNEGYFTPERAAELERIVAEATPRLLAAFATISLS